MSPLPIEFPVEGLDDGEVRLRLMTEADIPAIVEAVQDPEIPRFTTVPWPYGEEQARHWQRTAAAGVGAGTDLPTLVVDAEDGRRLGAVGVHNLDPESGRCSAGYWVAAGERGRGVARRALTLLSAATPSPSSARSGSSSGSSRRTPPRCGSPRGPAFIARDC